MKHQIKTPAQPDGKPGNQKSIGEAGEHEQESSGQPRSRSVRSIDGFRCTDSRGWFRTYSKVEGMVTVVSKKFEHEGNAKHHFECWAFETYGPTVKIKWQTGNAAEIENL